MSLELDPPPLATAVAYPSEIAPRLPTTASSQWTAIRLVPGFFVLLIAGILIFQLCDVMPHGNELSWDRSIFSAFNAITLTGFRQDVTVDPESNLGTLTLLGLTLAGTLFSLIAGGLAVVRIINLPYTDRQVIFAAFASTMIAVLVGTLCVIKKGDGLPDALLLAASAWGSSGLHGRHLGNVNSMEVQAVLMPLSLFGMLGLPVLMEIFDRATGLRNFFSRHTRTTLVSTAGIYLVCILLFFLMLAPHSADIGGFRETLFSASALSVNARGPGFPVEITHTSAMLMPLIALMIIGGNSGGAAGGVKPTTFVELGRGIRAALRGLPVRRGFGIAAAWLTTYVAVVLVGFLILLWRSPDVRPDRLIFISVSAVSNVGLSHDAIAMVGSSLYTLSLMMLAGRFAPLFVLWWMARTTENAEIAIG